MPDNSKKSQKQMQMDFAYYIAKGFSNEVSAIKAGYSESYAKVSAHKLLDNCEIKQEIERLKELNAKIAESKYGIDTQSIINDLKNLKDYGLAEEENKKGKKRKVDPQCALFALDKIAKIIGAFEEDNKQKSLILPQIVDDI